MLILLGLAALCFSLILTPLFRNFFSHFGFVDHPDLDRKIHAAPIPRAGGSAIACSYVLALLLIHFSFGISDSRLALVWRVLPGAAVMFSLGPFDDLVGLKPREKISRQFVVWAFSCFRGMLVVGLLGQTRVEVLAVFLSMFLFMAAS